MKILVITGSPHKKGCSSYLAEQFRKGALEAGHDVERVDAAFLKVHPCIGCDHCQGGKAECVFKDDMMELYPKIIESDAIIYSSPLYYHALSAQLLTVIDRFHGIDLKIHGSKKTALIVTGANPDSTYMDGVKAWFPTDIRYLGWKNAGELYVHGCTTMDALDGTEAAQKAFELGNNI